jgi:hypothetical protein
MDGWVVRPAAPALGPEWWRTWPPTTARQWKPGRYVRDGHSAEWTEAS